MRLFILQIFTYRGCPIVSACGLLQLAWLFIVCYAVGSALAQTPPITPSGLNTQINLAAPPPAGKVQYDITGGSRPGGGPNLFHSFGEFGVPSNNIANFLNETALPTNNVLARVTGGNISNIFGTIQTTGFGNANLFLLNPAGFLFGPTATVNVGGLVAFTSADYLKLTDNTRFNATPNTAADALLTALPVASFGFLGSNPGAITVQGSQFSVTDGQSISLVGGNITIQAGTPDGGTAQPARLSAPNGNILLGSAASPGEFDAGTFQSLPNVDGASFNSLGSASLAPGSSVDVSGTNTISIRGGQFILSVNDAVLTTAESPSAQNTISLSRGSSIVTSNSGTDLGADIEIVAGTLQMDGAMILNNTLELGDAGSIRIRAHESIALVDSDINSSSFDFGNGAGNAGLIWLTAPMITLQHVNLISLSQGPGNAGDIFLEARTLTVGANEAGNGSAISAETLGPGRGGDITIRGLDGPSSRAGDVTISGESTVTSTTSGDGPAGDINVLTERMALTNGSSMMTSSGALGDAGNMKIDAGQSVQVSSLSVLESTADDTGNAGQITIITPTLTVNDGGHISTSTTSSGHAGAITINATSVNLLNGGQLTSKSGLEVAPPESPELAPTGNAGNVTIEGTQSSAQSVLIDGAESGIFTDTLGTGAGGNVTLNANTVVLQNGGTLSAKTSGIEATATGGSITVKATDHATMTSGASITASSTGPGDAGNISINAGQQFEMRDSSVTAKATQASGGNIDIRAVDRVRLVNSEISSSVQGGASTAGGNIMIDPNVVVLQNSQITAQAVQGAGGNITIFTPLFLADATSLVSASSQFGLNGTVAIQNPTSNLSESVGTLPSEPSQAQTLLTQRCAALANGQTSSFVVAGREQLPADPGGWLTSPLAFAEIDADSFTHGTVATIPAIMATHDSGTVSLRRLTPAWFLMANFADSEATGCRS